MSASSPSGSLATSGSLEPRLHRVAVGLGVLTILVQISYPLLSGDSLRTATIATVLLFAAASLVHATATWGPRGGLTLLVVAGGIGLAAEAAGVATGIPFGSYEYTRTLGPTLLGVPLVVPLAWTMMAYPGLLVGRRIARRLTATATATGAATATRAARTARPSALLRRTAAAVTGAVTLAAWDLYLDPQMVAAGHWTWHHPTPALPGVPGIPLTNYAGWLLVALVMVAALDLALPTGGGDASGEAVPAALLTWTWLGSGLANLAFFDRPAVAGYGVVAMGLTVAPYLRLLLAERAHDGRTHRLRSGEARR
jgi:putative membrane protein